MKLVIGVTLAVVLIIGLGLGAMAVVGGKTDTATGAKVTIGPVVRGELAEVVNAPGHIEPRRKVEISARVSARIDELPFEEGDRVKAGDLLVALDASELNASLASRIARRAGQEAQLEVDRMNLDASRANLEALSITLADAKRDLQRQRKLLQTGDVSVSAVDDAQRRFDELQAQYHAQEKSLGAAERSLAVGKFQLQAADAEIAQARENLNYTQMRSPIDGVVIRVNAEVGELAVTGTMNNPGTIIMEVADLSQMLMVARVDESDVAKVKAGQEAIIHLSAFPDREFPGEIERVALASLMGSGGGITFEADVLVKEQETAIPTGLTADVDIVVTKHVNVQRVPSQAVLARKTEDLPDEIRKDNPAIDPRKTMATVVYRFVDGKAVVTPVRIGPSDITHTLVELGLNDDDRIITGPYKVLENIKHDQAVRDRDADAEKDQTKDAAGEDQPGDDEPASPDASAADDAVDEPDESPDLAPAPAD